ncbi:MAG: nucleoside hydrolase [candidate division NC10 bacterium]|nr:nucleoside hydrolase [candidate division NC10 bacterium]
MAVSPRPVVIDTDPGVDDALALCLALRSPELSVEAITTVAGNVPVEAATRNALRVLDLLRPARRPIVAQGASEPLKRPLRTAAEVHGEDGLGGATTLREPDGRPRYPDPPVGPDRTDAPDLLAEMAERFGSRLTLITLGPLTNLALALRQHGPLLRKVGQVVAMGGALRVPGNATPAAEFNVWVDPEAADEVLQAGLPLRLVGLDVTHQVRLAAEDLPPPESAVTRFIRDITGRTLAWSREAEGGGMPLHDPLAVAAAADPTLCTWEALPVRVETRGEITTGMTVADLRPGRRGQPVTCEAAVAVDAERARRFLLERLWRSSS